MKVLGEVLHVHRRRPLAQVAVPWWLWLLCCFKGSWASDLQGIALWTFSPQEHVATSPEAQGAWVTDRHHKAEF